MTESGERYLVSRILKTECRHEKIVLVRGGYSGTCPCCTQDLPLKSSVMIIHYPTIGEGGPPTGDPICPGSGKKPLLGSFNEVGCCYCSQQDKLPVTWSFNSTIVLGSFWVQGKYNSQKNEMRALYAVADRRVGR